MPLILILSDYLVVYLPTHLLIMQLMRIELSFSQPVEPLDRWKTELVGLSNQWNCAPLKVCPKDQPAGAAL